jgi:hypothetical protein
MVSSGRRTSVPHLQFSYPFNILSIVRCEEPQTWTVGSKALWIWPFCSRRRDMKNPKVRIGHGELAVRSIVVWAWIESRPDTTQTDEAAARKVLQSINYDGLSKLIEP